MSEHAGFLAAIRAAPTDDLPRLVYADWLEEHGQAEWAEFIRVQCELEHSEWADALRAGRFADRTDLGGEWRRLFDLRRREQELLHTWGGEWFSQSFGALVTTPTGESPPDGMAKLTVRRGFASGWEGQTAAWCGVGRAPGVGPWVARAHPLQVVTLVDRGPSRHPSGGQFGWWAEGLDSDRDDLPRPLWIRLRGYIGHGSVTPSEVAWYLSRDLALAAASAAAIAWALDQPPPS